MIRFALLPVMAFAQVFTLSWSVAKFIEVDQRWRRRFRK
jgi:hypothetical protein